MGIGPRVIEDCRQTIWSHTSLTKVGTGIERWCWYSGFSSGQEFRRTLNYGILICLHPPRSLLATSHVGFEALKLDTYKTPRIEWSRIRGLACRHPPRSPVVAHFSSFHLDLSTGELRCDDGKTVRLSDQPFRILKTLLEHSGEVVAREELRKCLWPNDTVVEFEHSISA